MALVERIRKYLSTMPFEEKSMFGGNGFMNNGNMACGIYKEFLIVRVGRERYEELLAQPHARPFDITGKVMKGWIMVDQKDVESEKALHFWLQPALDFVATLPPK